MRKRERNERLVLGVILTVIGFFLLAGIAFAALQAVPATPLHIYKANVEPKEVCPLSLVHVVVTYGIEEGYDIHQVDVTSTWDPTDPGGAAVPGGIGGLKNLKPVKRETLISPWVRIAPSTPGKYRLISVAEVTFDYVGIPRIQEVPYPPAGTVRVLSLDDPECKDAL